MKFQIENWIHKDTKQIAILPFFDIFWSKKDENNKSVVDITFGWMYICFHLWLNDVEDIK